MRLKITKQEILLLISGGVVLSFTGCSTQKQEEIAGSGKSIVNTLELDGVDYFQARLSEVESLVNQGFIDDAKRVAKDTFVTGVDFFFYDGEIAGVTIDEISDTSKAVIMDGFSKIDEVISSYDTNWKEELGDKYQVASEFMQGIYVSSLDKIKEYLGEENYQALGEIKDQILGDIVDIKDKAKEKAKSWYEEFRSE